MEVTRRRRGQSLGRPGGRGRGLRHRRLARGLGAGRRLARRRARDLLGGRGAARACRERTRPRSGCGWSTGPTRRARASDAASSARRRARARSRWTTSATCATARGSASRTWSPATTWTWTACPSPASACAAPARTSSCTSSRGRCWRASANRPRPCWEPAASSATWRCSPARPLTPAPRRCRMRRDSFAATAQAALAIREIGLRHEAASARSAAPPASLE